MAKDQKQTHLQFIITEPIEGVDIEKYDYVFFNAGEMYKQDQPEQIAVGDEISINKDHIEQLLDTNLPKQGFKPLPFPKMKVLSETSRYVELVAEDECTYLDTLGYWEVEKKAK